MLLQFSPECSQPPVICASPILSQRVCLHTLKKLTGFAPTHPEATRTFHSYRILQQRVPQYNYLLRTLFGACFFAATISTKMKTRHDSLKIGKFLLNFSRLFIISESSIKFFLLQEGNFIHASFF